MIGGARVTLDDEMFGGAPNWVVRHSAGQVVFDEGDPASIMYRVESGCVRLQVNGAEGARQIISFLFKGDLFGYSVDDHKISAEAVTETLLRCWKISSVLTLGTRAPEVLVSLIKAADSRVGEIAHHLANVTHLSATDRIRWFLSGLVNCNGLQRSNGRLDLPMTKRDVADYLGLSAETLSRALNDLETEGFVKRDGKRGLRLRGQSLQLKIQSEAELELRSDGSGYAK